jgi:uncharacterized membrane protein YraQ (UPF0718 family)
MNKDINEHSHQETSKSSCTSKKPEAVTSACCETEAVKKQTSSCCASEKPTTQSSCHVDSKDDEDSCCGSDTAANKIDWIMWVSCIFVVLAYGIYVFLHGFNEIDMDGLMQSHDQALPAWLMTMSHTTYEMFNAMWWGIVLGVVLVGWLNRIPREVVIRVLGPGHTKRGIFRATMAGLMLDLCNHGILMVAMKLYERGASLGQVMAFLIASPWNSFTLTLILFGLIGVPLTLAFIVFSMVIAWISGMIFDYLEESGKVPMNPNKEALPADYQLRPALKTLIKHADYSGKATLAMIIDGIKGGKMVIRWIMFGVVLVAFLRAFVPMDIFSTWFGATMSGLFLTLLAATVIEVCSEGSTPIAADLVTRAHAPGNGFTFLMAGAATDYTEIMAIKDTMKSWKIAMLLPLITVPQVLMIGWLLNTFS